MLEKEEVKHIAKLARLGLDEKEVVSYQKDLSAILDYMEKLRELDVSTIEATAHSLKIENVMRKDEAEPAKRKLIAGFLKVKSVFK